MGTNKNGSSMIISFLTLRRTVGILGIALPLILLILGEALFHYGLRTSISSYYHTDLRDVLVGTLFAYGIFLIAYNGYDKRDQIASTLGGIFAICVALLPTTIDDKIHGLEDIVGILHSIFTGLFFLTLIYFSLYLFTLSNKPNPGKKKLQRNIIYRVCGVIMILCIIGIGVGHFLDFADNWLGGSFVFWMEAFAIWAFGASWFVKGEAILKD